jgi:hypothetical protein
MDAKAPVFEAEEIRTGFPHSAHLIVENASHETLPLPDVQRVVVRFLAGMDTPSQRLTVPPPQFPTIEQVRTSKPIAR